MSTAAMPIYDVFGIIKFCALAGPASIQSALPNQLPTLSTQELEQIMELQRRLSSEMAANDSSMQLPLSFLSNLAGEVSIASGRETSLEI